ncbi:MAG: hypothetical protein A3K65_09005 [Euryarchaeota archaeon RBG_16_68_12]|nr:MAG: hypothetical protein A3K65_09005 [Euryarchaeota archaeon RBG_16_68_12]
MIVIAVVIVIAAVAVALIVVLMGRPPAPVPALGSITVIPNQFAMNIGENRTFVARAMSTDNRVLQANEVTVTWSIAPSGVGTLSQTTGLDTRFDGVAAGQATITATGTAGGVTKSAQANVTVLPPPFWADHYTITGPSSVVEGDPFSLTVTVIDNASSVYNRYRGTIHFTASDTDSRVVLPADYAFTAADAGTHSFTSSARLFMAGQQTINGVDAANLSLTGSVSIRVIANQLPIADFTFTKSVLTISADGSTSVDPDGTISSYSWQWGDGATGAGVTAGHTYAALGVYQVNLTVTDNRGATGLNQKLASFLVPMADFSVVRSGYRIDVDGSLSSDSDGTIASYAWTWGDASTGSGVTASHTYAGDGDYPIGLTVTDNDGLTGSVSRLYRFHSPTASYLLAADNLTANVDASGSSDTDGTIVSYSWEWGDGTPNGTGVIATHTYGTKGTFTINLTVTDNDGLTGQQARTLTVRHRPIAAFNVAIVGLTANVDGSASSDPDGTIVSWAWEWGDSTMGVGVMASHAYAVAGTYAINLTVTDDDGLTDVVRRTVAVGMGPQAPNISFTLTIDGRNFRLLADASASFDPDGTIVSYAWDWGDTTTGTGVTATHSYAAPQLYTVALTITDNDALTNVSSQPVSWFPPTARFTVSRAGMTVDVDGTSSSDPDGAIVTYTWDWGDSTITGGATSSHTYAAAGTYTITLNVTDADGFWNVATRGVAMRPPTATFSAARDLYTVSVDATASSDPDGTIVSYAWDWGDTGSGSGVTAAHTYAARGAYVITLTITDNDTLTATASRTVTVNATTLDYHYYDFFRVPYGEWWDKRTGVYGDLPIGTDCFNATSIADGECAGTTYSTYPYTDWFPAPGNTNPGNPNTNPLLYSTYRFNVTGKNAPAYTIDTPVIVPRSTVVLPGGSVQLEWYFQYIDKARATVLETQTPWNTIPADNCGSIWPAQDGFIGEATLKMTMDYNTSRKIFGVSGDPTAWWSTRVNPGCTNQGQAETDYEDWLVLQGGGSKVGTYPGTYDIFNAYQWYYGSFFTDIVWQVVPGPGGGNTTVVTVHHGAWGFEVLMARWFYYGRTTYLDHFTLGTPPAGWWGMELPWFEDFRLNATISTAFDFRLSSAMMYHFVDQGRPGPDGLLGTNDDYSAWAWQPTLADYVYSGPKHPYSEIDAYTGLTYLHDSPGSTKYGIQWQYDVRPVVWNLRAGETLTFHFPLTPVVFYDPVRSLRVSDPARLVAYTGTLAYDSTRPAGLGRWDPASGTWEVWGPTAIASPARPLYTDMAPTIWLRS